jgi:hypothetical protein
MNYCKHLFSLLLILSSLYSLHGQTNKKTLNYQAVILDPKVIEIPGAVITGQPLNKGNVCLRFTLLNAQGGVDYEETQQVTTDEYGLVNVGIGSGTQASNNSTSIYKNFESIVWNLGVKSLKVSVSFDGCATFKQVTTQGLNYTPYSLYSEAVDYKNVIEAPKKLSQFQNDESFLVPKSLDPLKQDIQTNSTQIETANQTIKSNKQTSDAAFLVVNQSLTSVDKQVTENTRSLTTMETKLTDQQNQIVDNRNQISSTNNSMNAQIGGLQGQINTSNSTVSNLMNGAEMQSNKSTAANLGGANPSDQAYPSQRAAKAYVDQLVSQIATSGVPDATTLAAGKLQLAGDLGGTATSPTVPALAGKENSSNKSTNFQTDAESDTKYPSVKAVKAYVDQATLGTALAADLANKANIASPSFTGTPTAPTPTSNDNSTKIATTAFVQAATTGIALQTSLDGKADKNSPTFTGTPALPLGTTGVTQALGDNSTKLATTAFVTSSVSAGVPDATTTASGKIQLAGDLGGSATSPTVPGLTLKAPLASPIFTGTPALPTGTTGVTQTTGDNSTKLATTAYVATAVSAVSGNSGVPYSGATSSVNLGAYDLTVNDMKVGRGGGSISSNTAMGTGVLNSNVTGANNTAIGYYALANNTGRYNTSIGTESLYSNTSGSFNTAIGQGTLSRNISGDQNVAVGRGTLAYNTTGKYNTAVGDNTSSNRFGNASTGNYNTVLGNDAFNNNAIGSRNTIIGSTADVETDNLSNSTAIGYGASIAASNTIQLGNTSVTNVKTSGTITAGAVTYPKVDGAAGTVLTANANGIPTWSSASSSSSGVPYTGASQAVNLGGYDLKVNELTIGSGKVGNSGSISNTIVGGSYSNRTFTTVLSNTAIGYGTMSEAKPGNNNTSVGAYSLVSTTGSENSVIGAAALERNLGGSGNTAIGYYSLRNNLTGSNNTALGHNSLIIDPPGSNNTIIGASADLGATNLTNATAIGYQAKVAASNTIQLGADGTNGTTAITNVKTSGTITAGAVTYPKVDGAAGTVLTANANGIPTWSSASSSSGVPYTGASQAVNLGGYDLTVNGMTIGSGKVGSSATLSTFMGEYALNRTNRGTDNTAIGYKSMGNEGSLATSAGTKNTAVGSWTLITNSGQENSAVGNGAMEQNQGGSGNTAMGARALQINLTGSNNTAIGYTADVSSNNLSNATAIGYGAKVAASNTIQLGNTDVTNVKTSGKVTAGSITYPNTAGTNGQVLTSNGAGTASWATAAGVPYTGATSAVNLGSYDLTVNSLTFGRGNNGATYTYNTAIGYQSIQSNTSGNYNTAIGYQTLKSNTDGGSNTAIGRQAMLSNLSGNVNTGVGTLALNGNIDGSYNAAFSNQALYNNTAGSYNTAIGTSSLEGNTLGNNNTAIGRVSLYKNTIGEKNTGIGLKAGGDNITGSSNTYLGYNSGLGITGGDNNTIIGANVTGLSSSLTNNIIIANGAGDGSSIKARHDGTSWTLGLIGSGTWSGTAIAVEKGGTGLTSAGTNGQVLTSTGSGTLAWTTPSTGGGGTHTIGESYGGGTVFYVYDGGMHGLIAATTDQSSSISWCGGCIENDPNPRNTRARADGINAGLKNTAIIIANLAAVYSNESASTVCNEYSVTETLAGLTTTYGDWYLPSKFELNLLYLQKIVIGGFSNANYWSSSESTSTGAWYQYFGDGATNNNRKDFAGSVRAIRAF